MRKNIFFIMVIFLAACGTKGGDVLNSSNPSQGSEQLKVAYAWIPENMMQFSSAHRSGLVNNKIFYIQNKAEEMVVQFKELDGSDSHAIILPKGKGPGEVVYTVGLRFIDGKIYFMDTALARVSVFDYDGNYDDDYAMNSETGTIWKFDIFDDYMYFNSFAKSRNICKYDLKNGETIKSIGENIHIRPEDGDLFHGGCIESYPPDKKIYYAYESYPVRIEEYDTELNLLRTIKRKDSGRKPMEWIVSPRMTDRHGEVAITSMKVDEKYLYVLNSGANYDNRAGRIEDVDLSVSIYDRKSGKYLKELYVKELKNTTQYASIVGVDKDHIVLTSLTFQSEDAFKELGIEMDGDTGLAFIIAENPMYGN